MMMVNIVWRLYHHLVGRVRRLALVMVVLRPLLLLFSVILMFLVGLGRKVVEKMSSPVLITQPRPPPRDYNQSKER